MESRGFREAPAASRALLPKPASKPVYETLWDLISDSRLRARCCGVWNPHLPTPECSTLCPDTKPAMLNSPRASLFAFASLPSTSPMRRGRRRDPAQSPNPIEPQYTPNHSVPEAYPISKFSCTLSKPLAWEPFELSGHNLFSGSCSSGRRFVS